MLRTNELKWICVTVWQLYISKHEKQFCFFEDEYPYIYICMHSSFKICFKRKRKHKLRAAIVIWAVKKQSKIMGCRVMEKGVCAEVVLDGMTWEVLLEGTSFELSPEWQEEAQEKRAQAEGQQVQRPCNRNKYTMCQEGKEGPMSRAPVGEKARRWSWRGVKSQLFNVYSKTAQFKRLWYSAFRGCFCRLYFLRNLIIPCLEAVSDTATDWFCVLDFFFF